MIVCFECKQAASKVVCSFVSNLSVVYLGDLFTCTQQMHWGICLPCDIWHLYAMTLSQCRPI